MSPRVSVVTPVFNRAEHVPRLAQCLAQQRFTDFEWIIVDDGSIDGLGDAMGGLAADFPVVFLRLGSNRGAASARNAGIETARGHYVALLDSDDAWHPDKLALQVRQLDEAGEGAKLVSLTRQRVLGRHGVVVPARLMTKGDDVGSYLFRKGGIIQSSMMMLARDLAASVRFEDGSRGHDDWSFALRLAAAGARFEMLAPPLTLYDDTSGRPRRSPSYSAARLDWLTARRTALGESAYWAAVAAVASHLPADSGVKPLQLIDTARRKGAIGMARAAYYALAWAFPPARRAARGVNDAVSAISARVRRHA